MLKYNVDATSKAHPSLSTLVPYHPPRYHEILDTTKYPSPSSYPSLSLRHDCCKFSKFARVFAILNVLTIPQVASPLRMDALLHVTRQLSKLDPNRLLMNIQHVAAGDSRAPSAWMSLYYDLKELEDVFHKLSKAGHDIRAPYRDFNDLRRWVYAAASTMSPPTPHSPHSTKPVPRSPHVVPAQSLSQRPPVTTSTRPEHKQSRVTSSVPPPPQQPHRSSRGQVIAPTPVRPPPSPKARAHVRFAPTALVYTVPRYAHATPPPAERPSCAPRSPRKSHAK